MRPVRTVGGALFSTSLLIFADASVAAAEDARNKALSEAAIFAEGFCGKLFDAGSARNVTVTGSAEAELSNFFEWLANLGVRGSAEINTEEYVGVLREELTQDREAV